MRKVLTNGCRKGFRSRKLSTSIYDLVLIYVCHFHHHFLLQCRLVKFDHYWNTRASILDACIQGILLEMFDLTYSILHWQTLIGNEISWIFLHVYVMSRYDKWKSNSSDFLPFNNQIRIFNLIFSNSTFQNHIFVIFSHPECRWQTVSWSNQACRTTTCHTGLITLNCSTWGGLSFKKDVVRQCVFSVLKNGRR